MEFYDPKQTRDLPKFVSFVSFECCLQLKENIFVLTFYQIGYIL